MTREEFMDIVYSELHSDGDNFRANRIIDAADTYKEDSSPQSLNRWIPVTERLPEKNGRYLVTRGLNVCGAMWNRAYLINYSDLMGRLKLERMWWNGNVGESNFECIDDVIAWMPLPESYKEVEE